MTLFNEKDKSLMLEKRNLIITPSHLDQKFSCAFLTGSFIFYLETILTIVAFASPYWIEASVYDKTVFTNLGLWNVKSLI